MKPSRLDVSKMTERDYFAQLICWRRGGDIPDRSDYDKLDSCQCETEAETIRKIIEILRHNPTKRPEVHNSNRHASRRSA